VFEQVVTETKRATTDALRRRDTFREELTTASAFAVLGTCRLERSSLRAALGSPAPSSRRRMLRPAWQASRLRNKALNLRTAEGKLMSFQPANQRACGVLSRGKTPPRPSDMNMAPELSSSAIRDRAIPQSSKTEIECSPISGPGRRKCPGVAEKSP
jgi:hypothetical protein